MQGPVGFVQVQPVKRQVFGDEGREFACREPGYTHVAGLAEALANRLAGAVALTAGVLVQGGGDAAADVAG